MRRLVLLCIAAAAAVSGYNLVLQEFTLTGGLITNKKAICGVNIDGLHVDAKSYPFDCYNVTSPTDATALDSINIVYKGPTLGFKAKSINCDITLADGSNVTFTLTPEMKVGQLLTAKDIKAKYTPLATPTTTAAAPVCNKQSSDDDKKLPICDAYCKDNTDDKCPPSTQTAGGSVKLPAKAKKIFGKPEPAAPAAVPAAVADVTAVEVDATLPLAVRVRGPGPARPPIRDFPEDTVVAEEDDEERRVKRADGDVDQDNSVNVVVTYYVLDEAGNPAAVWTAVIEGIILLVLVGLCFWFFFWSPRARNVATTAEDPYKEQGPNYSVSYANSSYNNQNQNQRIDAFQNPPAATPAAPPRPANSAYMDDYITDNIGAMSRNGAAAAPTPAASAINPASSAFQPGHQRFDSSGLVTVNLS